jgi:ADP-ribose pyrophosphatase YjhB (NUDIX family)
VPTWLIIILAVLLVLAVGGAIARAMQLKRTQAHFRARLEQANHDLAEAAAADRGWSRETLESAARRIYAEQRGSEPAELLLVEVLDRPGTDEDLAVFRAESEGRAEMLRLGRRDADWVLESLE